MRDVILYIACSVDGYIADCNGGVAWLEGDGSEKSNEGSYGRFIQTVDTVVVGYNTYKQIIEDLSPDKWVYEGLKTYVITHRDIKSTDDIIFTKEPLSLLISNLRKMEGKSIWICGGSSIINQMIDMDLIDTFTIAIVPTLLGDGIPLFINHKDERQLKLVSTTNYNGFIEITYKKR